MHHCTLNLRRNRGIKSFYDIEEYITNVRMSYDLAIKLLRLETIYIHLEKQQLLY